MNVNKYQFWLCDDAGRKILLLDGYSFFSYSRAVRGYGTIQIGIPHKLLMALEGRPFFQPDWRIQVYRRASEEHEFRYECCYILRKYMIYERESDGVMITEYFGRSPIDLLRRFGGYRANGSFVRAIYSYGAGQSTEGIMHVIAGCLITPNSKTLPDDFMAEQYPSYDNNSSVFYNPSTYDWQGKSALDAIRELQDVTTFQNIINPAIEKLYFDVDEFSGEATSGTSTYTPLPNGSGFQFKTYRGLRGSDRRKGGLIFSTQNGNLVAPVMSEDHLDEFNHVMLDNPSSPELRVSVQDDDAIARSRYNHCIYYTTSSDSSKEQARANARSLRIKNKAIQSISAVFRDSPGGIGQPQSLYGIDWNLGDLVRVSFAGFSFDCEVLIVYVSMDEQGKETVTGRNEIGS